MIDPSRFRELEVASSCPELQSGREFRDTTRAGDMARPPPYGARISSQGVGLIAINSLSTKAGAGIVP